MQTVKFRSPRDISTLRGCRIPFGVVVFVYQSPVAFESPRLVCVKDKEPTEPIEPIEPITIEPAKEPITIEPVEPNKADNCFPAVARLIAASVKTNFIGADIQRAWRTAARAIAQTDSNSSLTSWSNVSLSRAFESLGIAPNIAIHVANMFISSNIFVPSDPSFARTTVSLLDSLASGTDPPVSLHTENFHSLLFSLQPLIPRTINLSSVQQKYWPLLVSHMKLHSPNESIQLSYSIPDPNASSPLPSSAVVAKISIAGLTFQSSAVPPAHATSSIESLTPVTDARDDAARLALSFLHRYNSSAVSAVAASEAVSTETPVTTAAPVIRLGFSAETPIEVVQDSVGGSGSGISFVQTLLSYCQASGAGTPVYVVDSLESGLGFVAKVYAMGREFHGGGMPANKKAAAKEWAAKAACDALAIPIPKSVTTATLSAATQIQQQQEQQKARVSAATQSDLQLLNTFCQKNKVSLKTEFVESSTPLGYFKCILHLEKFGTWESPSSLRQKTEAKAAAAELALMSIGLKKPGPSSNTNLSVPIALKHTDDATTITTMSATSKLENVPTTPNHPISNSENASKLSPASSSPKTVNRPTHALPSKPKPIPLPPKPSVSESPSTPSLQNPQVPPLPLRSFPHVFPHPQGMPSYPFAPVLRYAPSGQIEIAPPPSPSSINHVFHMEAASEAKDERPLKRRRQELPARPFLAPVMAGSAVQGVSSLQQQQQQQFLAHLAFQSSLTPSSLSSAHPHMGNSAEASGNADSDKK